MSREALDGQLGDMRKPYILTWHLGIMLKAIIAASESNPFVSLSSYTDLLSSPWSQLGLLEFIPLS